MTPLLGHSITYRITVGPQAGRKVFTLQTLPASDEPFGDGVGQAAGFSLRAGVAARAHQRQKLERLCRYISRPAVSGRLCRPQRGRRPPVCSADFPRSTQIAVHPQGTVGHLLDCWPERDVGKGDFSRLRIGRGQDVVAVTGRVNLRLP